MRLLSPTSSHASRADDVIAIGAEEPRCRRRSWRRPLPQSDSCGYANATLGVAAPSPKSDSRLGAGAEVEAIVRSDDGCHRNQPRGGALIALVLWLPDPATVSAGRSTYRAASAGARPEAGRTAGAAGRKAVRVLYPVAGARRRLRRSSVP